MQKLQQFVTSINEINPNPHPSKGTYDGPYLARARAMVSIERSAGDSVGAESFCHHGQYRARHDELGIGLPIGTVPSYYSWGATFEAETQGLAMSQARAWATGVESKLNAKLLAREESLARWRRRMLEIGVPGDLLPETEV